MTEKETIAIMVDLLKEVQKEALSYEINSVSHRNLMQQLFGMEEGFRKLLDQMYPNHTHGISTNGAAITKIVSEDGHEIELAYIAGDIVGGDGNGRQRFDV